jgi:hypothetical protein
MAILKSSKRRPDALRPEDYDHEIEVVDHDFSTKNPARSRSPRETRTLSPGTISYTSSQRHSDAPLQKTRSKLRREITKRKYGKYQDHREGEGEELQAGQTEEPQSDEEGRGRSRESLKKGQKHQAREYVIDILYENQRGGFLCTIPLFSGRALGNLDPSQWTNIAQKTSATNITNAQVPDPSWEWAWKEWSINHTDEVDEEGWEYSFAFAKQFSWHGPSWWNSFVRRRAWIRKRVKKHVGYQIQEAHMLNEDYFTIHPALDRSQSRASVRPDSLTNRYSITQLAKRSMEDDTLLEDITDIATLVQVLKEARIDREKMEAVESFIKHGGDELYHLRERMHDVMGLFIFQASRRLLLTHLLKIYNETSEEIEGQSNPDPAKKRRLENLEAAMKHADEEVKRLEFWSDVKEMAEKGETKGAVDQSQGWGRGWTGLDDSGPRDVISERDLPGTGDRSSSKQNGTAPLSGEKKSKGKAKE